MNHTIDKMVIVVPCYNEEEVLNETTKRLTAVIEELIEERLIREDSFILYVNDGSNDSTWDIISNFYKCNKYVCGLNLAANVGHQKALHAGLKIASNYADMVISIDADLQDDISIIKEMVCKYYNNNDIVYGVRSNRETDTFFKRFTAQSFYKVMEACGTKIIYNHADFRLLSKRALNYLLKFKERNLFLRGIVPLLGFNSTKVFYKRTERIAGESKYPLKKMISFAIDGITSFSIKPLHMLLYVGILFLMISFIIFLWVIYKYIKGDVVSGWSSLMISLWFCSGFILVGFGIIGEYIGKIYIEVKERPLYTFKDLLLKEIENEK